MSSHFLKILKALSDDSRLSQRALSKKLGISLGRINYLINALIDKGHIKVHSFKSSKNKLKYMYILTPEGIKTKAELSISFLKRKMAEYDALSIEIEELKNEIAATPEE